MANGFSPFGHCGGGSFSAIRFFLSLRRRRSKQSKSFFHCKGLKPEAQNTKQFGATRYCKGRSPKQSREKQFIFPELLSPARNGGDCVLFRKSAPAMAASTGCFQHRKLSATMTERLSMAGIIIKLRPILQICTRTMTQLHPILQLCIPQDE